MITPEIINSITDLDEVKKATLLALYEKHSSVGYNRRWVSSQESMSISIDNHPDIETLTSYWLTNISSDAIIENVFVYKNGLLLRSPYPTSGIPWNEAAYPSEYLIDLKSEQKFIPPFEVHLNLKAPLLSTDSLIVVILYRSYIPGDYTFVDAITDLYLKKTGLPQYLDRDFHLFKQVDQ